MSSVFPNEEIMFTEVKANVKPFSDIQVLKVLKSITQGYPPKKPKPYPLNQKTSNIKKLSKDVSKAKDIIGSDCHAS